MLIDLDTLAAADRQAWASQVRYDRLVSRGLPTLADAAVREVRDFTATHPDAVCSTSWGKDSVVVAHLTWLADPAVPIVWVPTIRHDGLSYEADATYRVRDVFLGTHPGVRYEERPAVARNPKRGDPGYSPDQYDDPSYRSQDVLAEQVTEPYISGVRAEESRIRAISLAHRGITTTRTCRPIGRWSAVQVFAYLAAHDLPVHPAYAATYGGALDRRWLRVHPLRSKPPDRSTVHGRDMDAWEDHYFPALTRHRGIEAGDLPLERRT